MIRLGVFFLLLLAFDAYVFQAWSRSVSTLSDGWIQLTTLIYWSLPILIMVLLSWRRLASGQRIRNTWVARISVGIIVIYLSKIITGFLLMSYDLYRGFLMFIDLLGFQIVWPEEYPLWLSRFGVLASAVPLSLLIYGMIRNPYRYKVFKTELELPDLPKELDGLKVVQISDIHAGSFGNRPPILRGIRKINLLEPDLFFFTGDLVNSKATEIDPFIKDFGRIKARYGKFSVLGNHDYGDYIQWDSQVQKMENFQKLHAAHEALGWKLLKNDAASVEIGGKKISIIGVENISARNQFITYGDLNKAYNYEDDCDLRILLSHDPTHWKQEVVKSYKDIDLTLSGHTHGMQFGFEWGRFRWSPARHIYRQWAGLYQDGKQFLYVNRGFGFLGYPGRVGIMPEITLITLRSPKP